MKPAWKKELQRGTRRVTFPRPAAATGAVLRDLTPQEEAEDLAILERIGLVDDSAEFAASKWGDDE